MAVRLGVCKQARFGLNETDRKQLQSSHNTPHQAAGSLSSDHTRLYRTPMTEASSRSL